MPDPITADQMWFFDSLITVRVSIAQGQDGIPDTYFLVTNPNGLVAALYRAFISILSNASASSLMW